MPCLTPPPHHAPPQRLAHLITLAFLTASIATPAPQFTNDPTLNKLIRYLDARPYHPQVFEQLQSTAIATGQRAALLALYTDRLAATPTDDTARILLARLHARAHQPTEALELLAPLTSDAPELACLRGRLHFAQGATPAAIHSLRQGINSALARGTPDDRRLAEDALLDLARAQLADGQPQLATACIVEYADLAPSSFEQRMEAAEQLVDLGLDAAALPQLELAATLAEAENDPPRQVRAWARAGALLERRGELREADAYYARATRALGAGHWRRDDLFARRLQIHRRLGTERELIALLRAELTANPVDTGLHLMLAQALDLTGQSPEALGLLAAGARSFPDSIELATAHAESLARAGALEPAVAEYQRIAAQHPRATGLHRAAGLLLASAGDLDGAETQWQLELARSPGSVALRLELASLMDGFGAKSTATRLLQEARSLAPLDLRVARALALRSNNTDAFEDLERTARALRDADALEELAFEWLEREDSARAAKLVRSALDVGGDEERLLSVLVALDSDSPPTAESLATLLQHAALATRPAERVERIARYARACKAASALRSALSGIRDVEPLALRLAVHAHLMAESDQGAKAAELIAALLDLDGFREEALRHRAAFAQGRGDFDQALADWDRIASLAPRNHVEALTEIARLLRKAGRSEEARATEQTLLESAPRSATVLRDLAKAALGAKELERARDLYARLLALDPRDGAARYDLAGVLHQLGERDAALDELCALLAASDPALRQRAFTFIVRHVIDRAHPELRAEFLRSDMERAELSAERGLLLLGFLRAQGDLRAAGELLERLLVRHPSTTAVHDAAREMLGLTVASVAWPDARAALMSGTVAPQLFAAETLLRQGSLNGAERALAQVDPGLASQVLVLGGAPKLALRRLQRELRDKPNDRELSRRYAVACSVAGDPARAAKAFEQCLARLQPDQILARFGLLIEIGECNERMRSRSGLRDVGERLFIELTTSRRFVMDPKTSVVALPMHDARVAALVEFHAHHGLQRDFVRWAMEAPSEDLSVTLALLEHDWSLRPSERARATARLRQRPFSVWTDSEWRAHVARLAPAEDEPRSSSWARLR